MHELLQTKPGKHADTFSRRLLRIGSRAELAELAEAEAASRFGVAALHIDWEEACAQNDAKDRARDAEGSGGAGPWRWVELVRTAGVLQARLVWRESPGRELDRTEAWGQFVADLACVATRLLENAALTHSVHRLERAEHVQRALFAIANMASSELDMPQMLRSIHEIIGWLMYAENFFIVLYMPERDSLKFLYFVDTVDMDVFNPDDEIPVGQLRNSLTLAMLRSGESQMGPSAEVRQRLGIQIDDSFGPDSEDWLGVPMIGGTADIRGAIVVQSYVPDRRYTEEDRAILIYVAQHILTALERKQAKTDLERRVAERTRELAAAIQDLELEVAERQRGERLQKALFGIAECAATTESLEAFYASVHGIVGQLLDARNFYIALVSEDGTHLEFPYSVDEINAVRPTRPLANGMTEYVLRTGLAVLADRAQIDALVGAGAVQRFGTRAQYWLGVPLICSERTVGVLAVQSYAADQPFSVRDQNLLTFVAYHIANGLERKRAKDALVHDNVELEARIAERTQALALANHDLTDQIRERERIEARLTHEAFHDVLTGLPNRAMLLKRLESALKRQQAHSTGFSVLFLDLDRFKVVNDSVGHLVGDEMLKQVAIRLASACSPYMIARLGGDEFAILIDEQPDRSNATVIAARVLERLNEPIRVAGKELFTSASIGIAYADSHYRRAEELLRDADAAMYKAKARGRSCIEIFDEQLRAEAMQALDLEGDLRHALVRHEFEPHFQSIVSLEDGRVLGYEALLRWNHPRRGLLLPADFLAAAEENGCIEQIDWQMFAMACEQAHRLPPSTYISINVSARRLHVPDFDRIALRTIANSGLEPHRVRLEVTEGALLDQPEQTRPILQRLYRAGVLVKLDDFGTGYSSLSYLHRFPIHSLKIDRSFIADLANPGNSPAVVRAILALAESLGVEVIGEGIETPAQRDALLELGCTIGQGFLFSRPAVIDELAPA